LNLSCSRCPVRMPSENSAGCLVENNLPAMLAFYTVWHTLQRSFSALRTI
jgi:hypothetical protein